MPSVLRVPTSAGIRNTWSTYSLLNANKSNERREVALRGAATLESLEGDADANNEALESIEMPLPAENVPHRPKFHGVDIVQFSAPIYFVDSNEGHLMIDVMRIGSMCGEVRVRYETEDISAKAGIRYIKTSGEVVFADGVSNVAIKLEIMKNPIWAATMEFKVVLSDPSPECECGAHLKSCRVKLMDSKLFPSDRYREFLEGGALDESVSPAQIFWEYVKLNFQVEGIAWRTIMLLFFDQLENLYVFATLTLNIYLVDVVLNTKDPTSEHKLLLPSRQSTGFLIGALYVAPQFLCHCWEYVRLRLATAGLTRAFLQKNLFRKYMNLDETSRAEIATGDVSVAVLQNSPEVAEAYMQLILMAKQVGKLLLLQGFMLRHNQNGWWIIFLLPSLMAVYGICYLWNFEAVTRPRVHQTTEVAGTVAETEQHYELVADYFQRPLMNGLFSAEIDKLNKCIAVECRWILNFSIFPQYLGPLFAGFWIAWKVPLVLSGEESLGTLLAMVSVFTKVASEFSIIYAEALVLKKRMVLVEFMARIYNKPTELPFLKAGNRTRRALTKLAREKAFREADWSQLRCPITDTLTLEVRDVSFNYSAEEIVLRSVRATAFQSSLVAVVGEHGNGRQTLLRLIGLKLKPDSGIVLIPTHLRTLHVTQEPHLLAQNAWTNLTFGTRDASAERVLKIVERCDMKHVLKVLRDDLTHIRSGTEHPSYNSIAGRQAWQARLSVSERSKLHLARALIMNPEVMVLQRPFRSFTEKTGMGIMKIIKEHVKNRGVDMPHATVARRRPRTVFFSVENAFHAEQADAIWTIDEERKTIVMSRGGASHNGNGLHHPA